MFSFSFCSSAHINGQDVTDGLSFDKFHFTFLICRDFSMVETNESYSWRVNFFRCRSRLLDGSSFSGWTLGNSNGLLVSTVL